MLTLTPNGKHFAGCSETGAYITASRTQWTLVYERGQSFNPDWIYKTRHWQKGKVTLDQILAKAQKSLDKIIAQQGE